MRPDLTGGIRNDGDLVTDILGLNYMFSLLHCNIHRNISDLADICLI